MGGRHTAGRAVEKTRLNGDNTDSLPVGVP